eukprot:PhF_6_TR27290/c1_g1_i1/m.40083
MALMPSSLMRLLHLALLGLTFFSTMAYATQPSMCYINYTRPIRMAVIAPFQTAVGALSIAVADGARLAIDEANANGGIGGRTLELIKGETYNNHTYLPYLIDGLMADSSTELDAVTFMPFREHIDASMPAIRRHGLLLMGGFSGERGDFLTFDPN